MTGFTVEATMAAVTDGDWSRLRSVLDLVPGTMLIEDPDEPVLVFAVQADRPTAAFLFVDGILKLRELVPVSGCIEPMPEVDFDVESDVTDGPPEQTEATRAVDEWMARVPALTARADDNGRVEAGCA